MCCLCVLPPRLSCGCKWPPPPRRRAQISCRLWSRRPRRGFRVVNSHFNRSDQRMNVPPPSPHPCVAIFFNLFCLSRRETQAQSKAKFPPCENPQARLLRRREVVHITILVFSPQLSSNSHQAVHILMALLSLLRLLEPNIFCCVLCLVCFSSPIHLKRSCWQTRSAAALVQHWWHHTTHFSVRIYFKDAKKGPFHIKKMPLLTEHSLKVSQDVCSYGYGRTCRVRNDKLRLQLNTPAAPNLLGVKKFPSNPLTARIFF